MLTLTGAGCQRSATAAVSWLASLLERSGPAVRPTARTRDRRHGKPSASGSTDLDGGGDLLLRLGVDLANGQPASPLSCPFSRDLVPSNPRRTQVDLRRTWPSRMTRRLPMMRCHPRSGSPLRSTTGPPPHTDPRPCRRRGAHRHRCRRRGRAEHARAGHASRRRSGRAVPTRAQPGTTPRPRPRRGAGPSRLRTRPLPALGRTGQAARAPARHPSPRLSRRRPAQDPRPARAALARLAEAFLATLQEAGLPKHETGLAFSLVCDYTLGFALSSPSSVNEQRVRDPATRNRLHAFLQALPADRFATSLDTIIDGLETARRRHGRAPRADHS